MANTYTKIYIQVVFAVQNRKCLILESWKDELYKYITAIIQNSGHKLIAINGVGDHIHLFIGMKPIQALSDLVKHIKGDSSKWINKKGSLVENSLGKKDLVHFHIAARKLIEL